MSKPSSAPLAAIFGCAGPVLGADERDFFRETDPLGFIVFARNVVDPEQLTRLIADLRTSVGRDDAPVLIDQEGGRVQRLRPPYWRAAPPAAVFADLALRDIEAASRAVWLNARLIAAELSALGIDVDCTPVLDNPVPGAHDVIGNRAYGTDTAIIARLGRAVMDGLLAGGVLPIVKHIPGHGRAMVDSHVHCPVVTTDAATLEISDLPPFRALADAPIAMTAHVVYTGWDDTQVATWSPTVIDRIIRGKIGFEGMLLSDDLSMKALDGDFASRARRAQDAGCDVILHCNGDPAEMAEIATATRILTGRAESRVTAALAQRRPPQAIDLRATQQELDEILQNGATV